MIADGLMVASNILIDLDKSLSSHRGEIASFMKELHEVCYFINLKILLG
jgi:hypothetical protein